MKRSTHRQHGTSWYDRASRAAQAVRASGMGLAVATLACTPAPGAQPSAQPEPTRVETTGPAEPPPEVDCGAFNGAPTLPATAAESAVATGYLDFTGLADELVALEAEAPAFEACGLKLSHLRTLRVVVTNAGVVEGQLHGSPPRESLLQCPLFPELLSAAEANGWVVEDGDEQALRIRRTDAEPLDAGLFDFAIPPGQWLRVQGEAGTAERRVSVELVNDGPDEVLAKFRGPVDALDGVEAWCRRALDRQQELGLAWLADCRRPDRQTVVMVPDDVSPESAAQRMATVRATLFETFAIHGDSMLPNLRDGDVAFVDKTRAGTPPRGTVVVFSTEDGNYIKRVMGLPGERIELRSDGILIDDQPMSSQRTARSDAAARCGFELREQQGPGLSTFDIFEAAAASPTVVTIPAGHVFVLGDNRGASRDSRALGPIPVERILGRASFFAWSKVGDAIDWERTTSLLD